MKLSTSLPIHWIHLNCMIICAKVMFVMSTILKR